MFGVRTKAPDLGKVWWVCIAARIGPARVRLAIYHCSNGLAVSKSVRESWHDP